MLGLSAGADADQIRAAYRTLVKRCHPDQFLDQEEQKAAQEKLVALNLAYEAALKLAVPHKTGAYTHTLPLEEAKQLARKMLRQQNPESALRQLMRANVHDAAWYDLQGQILMQLRRYEAAHASFREAVRRCPDNRDYRCGALDAALAMKKSKTIPGRIMSFFRRG